MKPDFIMLVGLPGSGKSYFANNLIKNNTNIHYHSSDLIREELSGDIMNQNINTEVFETLHKRIKEDLKNGISTIYDATNTHWKKRKAFLQELTHFSCNKVCYVIATPYEVCLEQNRKRDRNVPENVIKRMYEYFDIPAYFEGWDKIELIYNNEIYKELYGNVFSFFINTYWYDQKNKHHNSTLGEHCKLCADRLFDKTHNWKDELMIDESKYNILLSAALLHDCGKPFTQTFITAKGNKDTNAHYYRHEQVGSYNSLFYKLFDTDNHLYVATLIRYHMMMWDIEHSPDYITTSLKWKNIWGTELYNDLYLLHSADKEAH